MNWEGVKQELIGFKNTDCLFKHFQTEINQKRNSNMQRLLSASSMEEVVKLQGSIRTLDWVLSLLNGDMVKDEETREVDSNGNQTEVCQY